MQRAPSAGAARVLCGAGSRQAQTRDARGPVRGTGVISGVVVSDDAEARPVRKARVTCGSPDVSGPHDDDRRCAGDSCSRASRRGAIPSTASKVAWVTMSLRREAAAAARDPRFRCRRPEARHRPPHAARRRDHRRRARSQQPAGGGHAGARVALGDRQRRAAARSGRRSRPTDDRGTYRIYGLAPGDYVVGASGRDGTGGRRNCV